MRMPVIGTSLRKRIDSKAQFEIGHENREIERATGPACRSACRVRRSLRTRGAVSRTGSRGPDRASGLDLPFASDLQHVSPPSTTSVWPVTNAA